MDNFAIQKKCIGRNPSSKTSEKVKYVLELATLICFFFYILSHIMPTILYTTVIHYYKVQTAIKMTQGSQALLKLPKRTKKKGNNQNALRFIMI